MTFPGSSHEKEKREIERERERERKEKRFHFSLRSINIRWSDLIGPRIKAHLLGEGYV